MVTLQKSGDSAVKFVFTDSDHYLYGNGELEVPVNSLLLVIDESEMVTFKKLSGDPFLSFRADKSNLGTKAAIEQFYKDNMVGSNGGSESGMTPSEVQEMIDESISGMSEDVQSLELTKADTSAVTAVANDVQTVSGQVATKVAITDFNAYSAATDSRLAEDEEVTAAALNDLQENKADTSAVTAVNDALTAHTSDSGIHVSAQEKNAWNAKAEPYSAGTGIEISGNVISATGGSSVTVDATLDSGSTNPVANSAITTAIDNAKAYYISFATIATTGIRDEDWDGIVAAIDDHRPIYAGYPRNDGGILYYGVECMNKNATNTQIILTLSDNSSHYFYTFTKNGSNDYTFTSETKPYVTDAEIATWNAKQDALSAGTGIEISGNVISATGGGGVTYSAGSGIAIDTANTISVSTPFRVVRNNVEISQGGSYNPFGTSNNVNRNLCVGVSHSFTGIVNNSMAVGETCTVKATNTFAQGTYTEVNNTYELGAGKYNVSNKANGTFGDSGNTLLSVGNGNNSSYRHNVFELRQNGDIYFPDTDNTTYAQYYQKPMVRLQDMYGALGGLKLVSLTQSEYDNLATKSNDTLYIINNVVS